MVLSSWDVWIPDFLNELGFEEVISDSGGFRADSSEDASAIVRARCFVFRPGFVFRECECLVYPKKSIFNKFIDLLRRSDFHVSSESVEVRGELNPVNDSSFCFLGQDHFRCQSINVDLV